MILLASLMLWIGPAVGTPEADSDVENPTDCHAQIDQRCSTRRGEEALRCRNEADAQCDIADAEQFIAAGDVMNAVSRIDQACEKYENLLNMMLADVDLEPVAAAMIRYAGNSASIFALLAREGEVEDLSRAVLRLNKSRKFLSTLVERREEVAQNPDLRVAIGDLTVRLATALDQVARREMKRADERFKSVGPTGRGDNGAGSYYRQAAGHAEEAFALSGKAAYKVNVLDAKLAQADLHAALSREARSEAGLACESYKALSRKLTAIDRQTPEMRKFSATLTDFTIRADRGGRACGANPRIAAGATLFAVGGAALSVSIGLYAQYASACRFGVNEYNGKSECLGLPVVGGETGRYTAQVHSAIGLAVVGGAVFTVGAALMIPGLVQRKRAQPRRFFFAPNVGTRQAGVVMQVKF